MTNRNASFEAKSESMSLRICGVALVLVAGLALWVAGAARPPATDTDSGVRGVCQQQFLPGQADTPKPPPTPLAGIPVRARTAKDKRLVAEVKTDKAGKFRLPLPPGDYILEISLPKERRRGAEVPEPRKVTVRQGAFKEVTFTVNLLGV
jgi:hypothetical protein